MSRGACVTVFASSTGAALSFAAAFGFFGLAATFRLEVAGCVVRRDEGGGCLTMGAVYPAPGWCVHWQSVA
ncbi:hypothetical protein AtDm6_2131 [Acetobacter tropicalis]|uniref:Secreted protein n=1 Tax=Acetobacter tropicalis TaxID=104102 RepID=A0A094YKH4_9PROT|nr:hypothetical protein AtDm6_2131 [Acetobacter tropicalis]